MNKQSLDNYLSQHYELKAECRIDFSSCVNYTYSILYNAEKKDLVLLEDQHACLVTYPPEPKVVHLEDIYQTLYYELNTIEKTQSTEYENYEYKDIYPDKEHYKKAIQHSIKWHQDKVNLLENFIATYLKLLKNRYKD